MWYTFSMVMKMKKKNSGFTLVELLAVVVILAVVITLASRSVFRIIRNTKEQTAFEMRESLKEAALTYSFTHAHLTKCSVSFSNELYENKNTSHINDAANASCLTKIRVDTLKEAGLFEDNHEYCNNSDTVVVYRYTDTYGNSEYKTYASDSACTN